MTPEEEAHWRYQLHVMTNYGFDNRFIPSHMRVPDEVIWLREQARYNVFLAETHQRRTQ